MVKVFKHCIESFSKRMPFLTSLVNSIYQLHFHLLFVINVHVISAMAKIHFSLITSFEILQQRII